MRGCAKPSCEEPAVATVGMRYAEREVVVGPLTPQRDPNLLDLCLNHANRLTPPFGWVLLDVRTEVRASASPASGALAS